jgi:hypothetical protein
MIKLFGFNTHFNDFENPDISLEFESMSFLLDFLKKWLEEHLLYYKEHQFKFYKNIEYHIYKYIDYFTKNSILHFFGEFHNPNDIDPENPPLFIWKIIQ